MKKIYLSIIVLLVAISSQAQVPQAFSYQAVIRNASNALVANQLVSERISLVKDSATGTVVYSETQSVKTNANGLVSLQIGTGNLLTGSFKGIEWGAGNYYISIETDPTGGSNYTINNITQLLSVPYALYAANGGTPGATGPKGDKGDTGAQGIQGIQGPKGDKGDTGVEGIQGIQGLTGATGAKGDSGARGLQGIQGIQGLKGDQGIQGIQGLTGATGAKGDSGVSVRTTKVTGDSLFVTLSTGKTLNAGYVRGLQGVSVDSLNVVNDSLLVHKSNGTTQNAGAIITPSVVGYGFSNFHVFDSAGTFMWIPPTGVTKIMVEAWGAGGGGGSGNSYIGGCGGSYGKGIYYVSKGFSYSITVGAGGLGSLITNNSGGNTSFDTIMTVAGGNNCCTNAPIFIAGDSSYLSSTHQLGQSSGGNAANGGYGGRWSAGYVAYNGNPPGGGGGASLVGWPGGDGARGRLIIWW